MGKRDRDMRGSVFFRLAIQAGLLDGPSDVVKGMKNKTLRHGATKMVMATCELEGHAKRPAKKAVVSEESFARAAALFRVFSDVSRLKLLDRLAEREWCVTELAEAAGVGLSTVSQQLRLLRAEHTVQRRRTGKHIYYSLADRHIIELVANALEHAAEEPALHDDDAD
jgi:ArsR family transcriptional regulator, lead/cadmium/zinc/bismuth-responsive transcriptional repressor